MRPSVALPDPTAAIPPPDPILGGISTWIDFSWFPNSAARACKTSIPSPVPTISRELDCAAAGAEKLKPVNAVRRQSTTKDLVFMAAVRSRSNIGRYRHKQLNRSLAHHYRNVNAAR